MLSTGIERLDTDHLDGHQPPVAQPLASGGCPPCIGGNTTRSIEATVGDPVALRQKAAPGGNFLKPT